jgi:hypothetical protein
MASSEGTAARPATVRWPVAAQATLHCLTGCAIGEVLIGRGMGHAVLHAHHG